MAVARFFLLLAASVVSASTLATRDTSDPLASCPSYKASNIKTSGIGLTADLTLAGKACNVYGTDLTQLTLTLALAFIFIEGWESGYEGRVWKGG